MEATNKIQLIHNQSKEGLTVTKSKSETNETEEFVKKPVKKHITKNKYNANLLWVSIYIS